MADYLSNKTYGLLGDKVYDYIGDFYIRNGDIDNNNKLSLCEFALLSEGSSSITRQNFETKLLC